MRYFKNASINHTEYYRVFPNGRYEYRHLGYLTWCPGTRSSWKKRCEEWSYEVIEISKLEVLVVLGPGAIDEDL